jgi:hypothetical protein
MGASLQSILCARLRCGRDDIDGHVTGRSQAHSCPLFSV